MRLLCTTQVPQLLLGKHAAPSSWSAQAAIDGGCAGLASAFGHVCPCPHACSHTHTCTHTTQTHTCMPTHAREQGRDGCGWDRAGDARPLLCRPEGRRAARAVLASFRHQAKRRATAHDCSSGAHGHLPQQTMLQPHLHTVLHHM